MFIPKRSGPTERFCGLYISLQLLDRFSSDKNQWAGKVFNFWLTPAPLSYFEYVVQYNEFTNIPQIEFLTYNFSKLLKFVNYCVEIHFTIFANDKTLNKKLDHCEIFKNYIFLIIFDLRFWIKFQGRLFSCFLLNFLVALGKNYNFNAGILLI